MGNRKMRKQCSSILAVYKKLLKVLFLLTLFCFLTAVPDVQAGNGLRQIPLRWCAVQGSPAVTNPGGVGEPDTDNVLWRRHERASDNIWIPFANITFRSGFTAAIRDQATFPIIDDPTPPASGGPGQLGDILDPQINSQELNNAIASCQTAWNNLATQFDTPLLGPIALNLRQFVNNTGNPVNLIGWGGFTTINGGANTCANPPTGLTSAINGYDIRADLVAAVGGENGQASYDAVSIQMPNAVRGIAATQIRIQAIAQRLDPEGQLDRLPEPRDGGDNIVLVPPKFPVCSVTPTTIPAGGIATVEANSLIPNRTAKVFLGDQMVATPPIDNQGNVSTNFIVPSDSREGSRLVTVGVMGTALTADCSVNVTPPKLSRYEYTPKLVCGIQKDPRNMGLAKGFYGTTINIHNPGLSKVGFAKKLALTFPPGNQNSGQVLPIAADELESNHALAVDCNDLRTRLFNGTFPEPYIEGFVVIQSPQSLDVTAVYTNADLNWKGQAKEASSIDVEQINERINLEQN
jgi:hypothetical protein